MAFVFIHQYSRARARQPYPVSARKFRIRTTRHKQARSLAVSDMATSATPTLSMKLLIDGKAQRVLFAEASKEVVDFLFFLLALPVATAVKLVGKEAMVGCVGNLYASVEKLDSTYVQPGAAKASLLSPTVLSPAASAVLRLPAPSSPVQPKTWYRCTNNSSYCRNYIADTRGKACPFCGCSMSTAAECLSSAGSGAGRAAGGGAERGERVRAGHRDVHGAGQPDGDAHVRHLQHHAAQHLRGQGHRRPPGEDRAARLQRGPGDSQGVAAVQVRPHRRLPPRRRQEGDYSGRPFLKLKGTDGPCGRR